MKPTPALLDKLVCWNTSTALTFVLTVICALNLDSVGTIPTANSPVTPPVVLPLTRDDLSYSGQSQEPGQRLKSEWDWDLMESAEQKFIPLNDLCSVDENFETVICKRLTYRADLPHKNNELHNVKSGVFLNISSGGDLKIQDFHRLFPRLTSLSICQSPGTAQKFMHDLWAHHSSSSSVNSRRSSGMAATDSSAGTGKRSFSWFSVRHLNLSGNELETNSFPFSLMKVFPNLTELHLRNNNITTLSNIPRHSLNQLKSIDLSDNPLDCSSEDLEWVDRPNITLLNLENTVCDRPPHQNKPKPILQTIHLIKKVKAECRVNCSCVIDYIWEQDKVIHSMNAVNCSDRNFQDFPDPDDLPKPTDTLYLNNNQIQSIEKFARDERYGDLNVRNLYLESNQISSINALESSDWIYNFQVLSLRNNSLTDVPVYMLENIIRENKWLYLIDLSLNDWKCDCRMVSTFKVWLLRHDKIVKNIEDVKCDKNKEQVRYLKNEDWCTIDEASQMIELLDYISIFLAVLILLVISKVVYDYWNFKQYGTVPWIVRKM